MAAVPSNMGAAGATKNEDKAVPELLDIIYLDTTPAVDDQICRTISRKIRTKETSLVNLVEILGPRLTSTHVQERSKAVEILAHVFTYLPSDFLSEGELKFIVDFLCDRCKDQHIVIPKIIMCVLPIARCKNLPPGSGAKLLDQLFREANIQSHIHKIRHTFFRTLQFLLANRLQEIQNMSTDFVMNFLQSMDGEKDPRNLLLLFRIIPSVISNFQLGPFIEDFFEILSCYFPIDFNPTVNVPGEEFITRKDLAKALHVCLSQTNEFSEFLLPLIMEKLESSSVDAKVDSLDLLQLCCERSYEPKDLEPHLGQIWHVMRKEIFMGGNDEVERKCYEFLRAAFKTISRDITILNTSLTMVFSECKHHLSEPELRLIMPTSNILRCITESGETACCSVVKVLFPVLYEQICMKPTKSEKKRLLEIWEVIISTCRQYKELQLHVLVSKWDEMRGLWFTLLTSDDWELVTVVLKIFSHVLVLDADFPKEHRNMLQEHLPRIVRAGSGMPQDTRLAVVVLCKKICHVYGEEFSSTTVPRLLGTLSHSKSTTADSLCDNKCEESVECYAQTLSCKVLGECSHLHQISFQKVVAFLLEKLELNPIDLVCLKCLSSIVENACKPNEDGYSKPDLAPLFFSLHILDKIISAALEICNLLKLQEAEVTEIAREKINDRDPLTTEVSVWEPLSLVTDIVRKILRSFGESEQYNAIAKYWESRILVDGCIESEFLHIPGLLVEGILGPIRPKITITAKRELVKCILQKILVTPQTFVNRGTEFHIMPYVRLLGSLLNKLDNDEELQDYLEEVEACLKNSLYQNSEGSSHSQKSMEQIEIQHEPATDIDRNAKTNLIKAIVWIVKGLAMRGFGNLDVWVDKIIGLLKDESFGEEVVNYFHFLVADDPFSLNPESFCRYRFLYKQRLFLMNVDKLVVGYRTASSQNIQFNFIRALSSQLKHVPSEILFMEIDSVLPLLVASLKCSYCNHVLLSTLNALTEMMSSPDTKDKLTEYCHDLVPQLTRLAQHPHSMDVKRMSLSCLRKCAKAPPHVILPLRELVIDNLQLCLDDPKRLVRKEAVKTRSLWMLIGAPGGL